MWKIGQVEIENPIVIAPMAGISNAAFRTIAYQFGAGLIYTEMISDKAICYSNKKTLDMTYVEKEEHPIAMQLFGNEKKTMVEAAMFLDQHTRCDIIDINMGCPVPKVVNSGSGSAMLKSPEESFALVKEIVSHVQKPVSVKIRLGWDSQSINVMDMAEGLESAGISALGIHGRTRSQYYEGVADWDWIGQVKKRLTIPVMGNGDIRTVGDALEKLEKTGVDGLMIGRGVLGNPWLIRQLVQGLQGDESDLEVSNHEKLTLALDHAQRLCHLKGERVGMKEMRGHACWYIQGLPYSNKVKGHINHITEYKQFEKLFNHYEASLLDGDLNWLFPEGMPE